jgi:hypothetical protein
MLRRLALAAALVLGGTVAAQAAGEPVIKVADEMPDAVLRAELEHVGFDNARDIRRDGDTITATAEHEGKQVRLAIDARTGVVRVVR